MSSDGELSAIGKKEWEKRLKVRSTSVSDPEPDLDLIHFDLTGSADPDPGRSKLSPEIFWGNFLTKIFITNLGLDPNWIRNQRHPERF
jgi:hypothetical protein